MVNTKWLKLFIFNNEKNTKILLNKTEALEP